MYREIALDTKAVSNSNNDLWATRGKPIPPFTWKGIKI